MKIEKMSLAPEFEISRVMKGGWQLSAGHSEGNQKSAIEDMFAFVDASITTFDCADIYTGVEELIGSFRKEYRAKRGMDAPIQVFTKYVPDYDLLAKLTKQDVERVIDRSLSRLGVEQLDMVQFSWWNYAVPKWVETAQWLKELQRSGKIKLLGGTNFNTLATKSMTDAGVRVATLQIQYSLLDNRPEKELSAFCQANNIHLVCYGTVAGGFLSEHWLGKPEPMPPFENRSLIKYKLMVEEIGGWDVFQNILRAIHQIALQKNVSITNVATRYILQKPCVAAAIIGARSQAHIADNLRVFDFELSPSEMATIENALSEKKLIAGDVFDLERIKDGPHGRIMRYNLNK
jgi:aryl-alcohol dehydrogenase-like predicted oxidoreductase